MQDIQKSTKKEIKSLEILPIRNNQCYHFVIIFAATLWYLHRSGKRKKDGEIETDISKNEKILWMLFVNLIFFLNLAEEKEAEGNLKDL